MCGLQYSLDSVLNKPFDEALNEYLCNKGRYNIAERRKQIDFITKHLNTLKSTTIVIETNYIDHDFVEDYSSYYSRCFRPYNQRCARFHFFKEKYDRATIEAIIVDEKNPSVDSLRNSYLGFIVIRPLSKTTIGRACIIPEATDLHFHATCEICVSFFGIMLSIRCMPFQEQDSAVAACATTALWSASNVTARLFCHSPMTPSKITLTAKERGVSLYRALPNKDGLSINEMAYVIRRMGLDVMCVDLGAHLTWQRRKSIILGNVFSYLSLGTPIIIVGQLEIGLHKDHASEMHAVVANGYQFLGEDALKSQKAYKDSSLFRMTAGRISTVFVSDDRISPYSSLYVNHENVTADLTTELCENFAVKYLLVPLNEKIRVSYEEIWNLAFKFDGLLLRFFPMLNVEWRISLQRSNDFKCAVRAVEELDTSAKRSVLLASLPKYLWVISVYLKGKESVILGIDSTDVGQGLNIACAVFRSMDFPDLVGALAAKKKFVEGRNPVYDTFLAAFERKHNLVGNKERTKE